MENPKDFINNGDERGRVEGRRDGRGSRPNFRPSNSRYFDFEASGIINGIVVQSSKRRPGYNSKSDKKRYSKETVTTPEVPLGQSELKQPQSENKDSTLIEAASNGETSNFLTVLKSCLNKTSKNGLDIALLKATVSGNKFIIQQLLHSGARTVGRDEQGFTPLMVSAEKGYLDISNLLLRKGANCNDTSKDGKTALLLSLQPCGASDLVSLLLSHCADVNAQCSEGITPLMKALELRDLDATKLLIDAGARLDRLRNQCGETAMDVAKRLNLSHVLSLMQEEQQCSRKSHMKQSALMKAASSCNIETFKLLLDCSYTEVNKTNKDGSTLMQIVKALCKPNQKHNANTVKRFEMIKLLLLNGAKADDWPSKDGNALMLAVKSGQNELVSLLCHSKVKLNHMINDRTVLMIAVEKGNTGLVNILLDAGADFKIKNSRQEDALLISFKYGQVECAKILIQRKATLNVHKAAITAIENNRLSSLQYLVAHQKLNVNNTFLLHRAIQQNNVALVKFLIDKGADVNQLNDGQDSPLLLACEKDVSCVELLIKNGADVNLGHPLSGPPLIKAVPNVAKILLKHGADVNMASSSGETALMQACSCFGNTYDMVKLLLEAGADVNLTNDQGDTCLHYAIHTENIGNIRLLLQYGAKVNSTTKSGDTPFLLAAEVGNIQILNLFQEKGANIESVDAEGCNALLRAIKACDVSSEVIKLLAFNKDHLNRQNKEGFTPLMFAAEIVNFDILQTLLELGADVNSVNVKDARKNEITALSILLDNSQIFKESVIRCIEALLKYGALSSLPKHCLSVFHKMIVLDKRRLVQLFVTHGMSPCNVDLQPIAFRMGAFFEMQMLRYSMNAASPLYAALASGNADIAKYLAGNWFLTPSDLSGLSSQCSKFLDSINMQECVEFLEEFSSQPMSLMKLSFVAVSAAIGTPPGREARIMQLPIPSVIKDKLLFRKEEVSMDSGADEFNDRFGILDVGPNEEYQTSDSPSGVFMDFDDPHHFMYDSDSDFGFSGVMYDSDDTYMYI